VLTRLFVDQVGVTIHQGYHLDAGAKLARPLDVMLSRPTNANHCQL
jgi:hypothetical protein